MAPSLLLSPHKSTASFHGRTRSLRDGLSAISESLSCSISPKPLDAQTKHLKSANSSVVTLNRTPRKVKSVANLSIRTSTLVYSEQSEEKQVLAASNPLPKSERSFRLYPKVLDFNKTTLIPNDLPVGGNIARTTKRNKNERFKAKPIGKTSPYKTLRRSSSHIAGQKVREGTNAWQSAKEHLRRSAIVSPANTKKPLPPPPGCFSNQQMLVKNKLPPPVPNFGHRRKPSPPILTAIPESPSELATSRAPTLAELPGNRPPIYQPTRAIELEPPASPVQSKDTESRPVTPTTTTTAFEEIFLSFAQFSEPQTTEVPLLPTPPDTPEYPKCGLVLNIPEWDSFSSVCISTKISKEPGQSWLSLSPPSSCSSSIYTIDLGDPIIAEVENHEIFNKVLKLGSMPKATVTLKSLVSLHPDILIHIFQYLPTLSSITSFSEVAKPINIIYTSHQHAILSGFISHHSPALHLLAKSLALAYPSAIKHCRTIAAQIRYLIRTRCNFFPDTSKTESAIYNMWRFSHRFFTSQSTPTAQVSWLRSQNFSLLDLKDMLEVYQSVGILLCPLTTEVGAAVKAGVVQDLGLSKEIEMEEALELWVMNLQTLPLDLLLPLIAIEEYATAERWEAVVQGRLAEYTIGRDGKPFFRRAFGEIMAAEMMRNRI